MGRASLSAWTWQDGAVWAAVVLLIAYSVLRPISVALGAGDIGPDDPFDDIMRLMQVRDWMGGQSWFDTDQNRLGVEGTRMHWSRLVDVPIAALALLIEPFAGRERALLLAATVWPPMLGGVFVAVLAAAGRSFGGTVGLLVGAVGGAVIVTQLTVFIPGRIDHHNWQMILLALAATALVAPTGRAHVLGAAAGAAVALSIAIGTETLVFCAVLCAYPAIDWAWTGAPKRAAGFGAALAAAMVVLFFVSIPPARYGLADCDQISVIHVLAAVVGGGGLFLLARFATGRGRWTRLAALLALGVVAVGLLAASAPHCLANPLDGLPEPVTEFWLSEVAEAKGFADADGNVPLNLALTFGTCLVAAALLIWSLCVQRSAGLLLLLVLVAGAAAFTIYQIRYTSVLWAFSALSLVVVLSRFAARERTRAAAALAVLAAFIVHPMQLAFPVGMLVLSAEDGETYETDTALEPCDYDRAAAELGGGQPLFVMAPFNAGPTILMDTPHRVLASNYHRGAEDIARHIDIATSPPDQAVTKLQRFGVERVVHCAYHAAIYAERAPDGLHAALSRGEPVAGLTLLWEDGARVYAVER